MTTESWVLFRKGREKVQRTPSLENCRHTLRRPWSSGMVRGSVARGCVLMCLGVNRMVAMRPHVLTAARRAFRRPPEILDLQALPSSSRTTSTLQVRSPFRAIFLIACRNAAAKAHRSRQGRRPPSSASTKAARAPPQQDRGQSVRWYHDFCSGYVQLYRIDCGLSEDCALHWMMGKDRGWCRWPRQLAGRRPTSYSLEYMKGNSHADQLPIGCWASQGYSVAGCAALESQLRACMDAPVCPTSSNAHFPPRPKY